MKYGYISAKSGLCHILATNDWLIPIHYYDILNDPNLLLRRWNPLNVCWYKCKISGNGISLIFDRRIGINYVYRVPVYDFEHNFYCFCKLIYFVATSSGSFYLSWYNY